MDIFDGGQGYLDSSASSATGTSVSWIAYTDRHYVRVGAVTISTTTLKIASYRLDVDLIAEEPTSTNTPTPTETPIPTNTPQPTNTPVQSDEDKYEKNNSPNGAYTFPVATSISLDNLKGHATFHTPDDKDWYRFWAKDGHWYQVTTSDLSDVDTLLRVCYDVNENDQINESDECLWRNDDSGTGYASKIRWKAEKEGYHYIRVTNKAPDTTGSYNMTVQEVTSSSTQPTSTPGAAPSNPKADRCDKSQLGNHDFDHACVISPNQAEEFNFCPPPYGGADNDFFKIWVKPGLLFECSTSKLDPGVDPNMIVYDNNRNTIGGKDDVEPGDFNSYFSYYAVYEGWLYLLVGTGDRTPADVCNSSYTLLCSMHLPGQPTATSRPVTSTPRPTTPGGASPSATPTATPTPAGPPTATPLPGLTVRPLTTPTPVPVATPAPRFIPIRLLIYHDANDDRQPGAGEGIAGISAQAYEVATNQLLAQGFTDEQGNLEFTVAAQGPVRVSVPYFGFSQLVSGEGASIYLRVPPQPLSGGAP
jgi:hypothetical protein